MNAVPAAAFRLSYIEMRSHSTAEVVLGAVGPGDDVADPAMALAAFWISSWVRSAIEL